MTQYVIYTNPLLWVQCLYFFHQICEHGMEVFQHSFEVVCRVGHLALLQHCLRDLGF